MFCRNQLTVCKRKCFFQQPWLFFIKSEILKSDDLKSLSECCLSLKTGGMDGKKKRRGMTVGKTAKTKKAIVALTEESKDIEIFEGL